MAVIINRCLMGCVLFHKSGIHSTKMWLGSRWWLCCTCDQWHKE